MIRKIHATINEYKSLEIKKEIDYVEAPESITNEKSLKPSRHTINKIMAYSKALKVIELKTLDKEIRVLN